MRTLTPAAGPLDGSETIALNVGGRGGTLTTARLRAWVRGGAVPGAALPADAANPPVGQPAIVTLDGTEQMQTEQENGTLVATTAQLAAYLAGAPLPSFALAANGAGLSGVRATTIGDTEAIWVTQARGTKATSLAALRAFVAT